MYLHLGNNIVVNTDEIIGIFDTDNTTVSRQGKNFLPRAQDSGIIINAASDLPKSFAVTKKNGKVTVYISSYTSKALAKNSASLTI
ncbi:MAG: DUF370 domain-containing protein [Firmicutes bacterium]|nr:DUF370 domain-containing protein [Bacillota bacterium]